MKYSDTEMLDWMITMGTIVTGSNGSYVVEDSYGVLSSTDKHFNSQREAIVSAMLNVAESN